MHVPRQLLFACTFLLPQASVAQAVAITNVTVINPREGVVEAHRTVLIGGKTISAVRAGNAQLPKEVRLIPGDGKFLIPGLWDAHVHLSKAGALALPLFVANGVTSVRDMGSDLAEILQWRFQIESGKRIGPHIKTSGQMLESRVNIERMKREHTIEPVDRLRIGISNPKRGRAAVDQLADAGADHIKMRTTADLASLLAVGDEARRRHLPFATPPVAGLDELIEAHVGSVEHLLSYPPIKLPARERQELFRRVSTSGMFLSDTSVNIPGLELSVEQARARLADTAGQLDPWRKYVCGYLVRDWREQAEELKDMPKTFGQEMSAAYRDSRDAKKAGMPFLAGTDVAVLFMYPGFSLHDELAALVNNLGFTPMEALRIATYSPLVFYSQERTGGVIGAGQPADLVLLDADPTQDIHNSKKIRGVMSSGRWFDRKALDGLLSQVEQHAQSDCSSIPVQ